MYVCSNLVFLLYYEVPDQFADGAPLEMAQSLSHEGIPCDRQTIKPVYRTEDTNVALTPNI